MGAYKGLAHYDQYDPLETLLKNVIDTHKNALGYVNDLIACDPLLDPILGPSMSHFPFSFVLLMVASRLRYQVHSG